MRFFDKDRVTRMLQEMGATGSDFMKNVLYENFLTNGTKNTPIGARTTAM
jgi:hypothetical protein